MSTMTIDLLNKEYAIHNQLSFLEGVNTGAKGEDKHGFPFIKIDNNYASAVISIYGGQVLSFLPKTEKKDLLFVSDSAFYKTGKAIKGGIPICWPWFGNDPENQGRAAHGFVRNRMWSVQETATTDNGETQVSLCLVDTSETRLIWPYAFNLTLKITVGKELKIELLIRKVITA